MRRASRGLIVIGSLLACLVTGVVAVGVGVGSATQLAGLSFALGAFAGLRAAEIRALRWRDVDLARGEIVVREARSWGVTARSISPRRKMR